MFLERSPTQQHSLGLIIAVTWVAIYFAHAPFANHHDNIIARVSSVSLALLLLGALVLPSGVPPQGWRREWGAPLLIAFTAAPILAVVWGIGKAAYQRCKEVMTPEKEEEEAKDEERNEEKKEQTDVDEVEQLPEGDVQVTLESSPEDEGDDDTPEPPKAGICLFVCDDS